MPSVVLVMKERSQVCLHNAVDVIIELPPVEEPGIVGDHPVDPGEVHPVVHEIQNGVNPRLASANDEVILWGVTDSSQT